MECFCVLKSYCNEAGKIAQEIRAHSMIQSTWVLFLAPRLVAQGPDALFWLLLVMHSLAHTHTQLNKKINLLITTVIVRETCTKALVNSSICIFILSRNWLVTGSDVLKLMSWLKNYPYKLMQYWLWFQLFINLVWQTYILTVSHTLVCPAVSLLFVSPTTLVGRHRLWPNPY